MSSFDLWFICRKGSEVGIVISATCATLAASLSAASPGDTIRLQSDCEGLVDIRNRRFAAPGVTIDATGRNYFAGLRIWDSTGLTFTGGTVSGPSTGSTSYAVDLRRGADIGFHSMLFTRAVRGIVVNATNGIIIRNNRFAYLRSDGINLVGRGDNALVENNVFRDFDPGETRCRLAEETRFGMSKVACAQIGGSWTDTYHPDAIQTWANWGKMTIRQNDIEGETQGINTFGAGPPQRMDVLHNRIHISYPQAINNRAAMGVVIGNVVSGYGNYVTKIGIAGAVVACGNSLPPGSPRGPDTACAGTVAAIR